MIKKIGIFLPIFYQGGSLNGAKNVAKMLALGSQQCGDDIQIIFSCKKSAYNIEKEFKDLVELGIAVRESEWEQVAKKDLDFPYLINDQSQLKDTVYQYPTEPICNFQDCDFWLIISDRLDFPLAPIKPYGILVYDYIQRYIPDFMRFEYEKPYIDAVRQAEFVLTTTPQTRQDAIQYAGVSEKKVYLMPMEFNPFQFDHIKKLKDDCIENFIIWPTNIGMHKNHLISIEALNLYYQEYDGKFKVVITGSGTLGFTSAAAYNLQNKYVTAVKEELVKYSVVLENLIIKGNLSVAEYIKVLRSAKFLFHPTLIDNGTFSVIEAAYQGVPSLVSDYGQMRYINDTFKLNMKFFDAYNAQSIAYSLKNMEENFLNIREKLPNKNSLEEFTYKNLAKSYWTRFKGLL